MLPLQKIKFHLIIHFPEDYPRSPPQINASTSIPHPNVFGSYICLDMLQPPKYAVYNYETDQWETKSNGSWSSAYSVSVGYSNLQFLIVQSILMQLQSFLFDENVPQWQDKVAVNKVEHWQRENTYLGSYS
jgi:ubiquitin-protein ligase